LYLRIILRLQPITTSTMVHLQQAKFSKSKIKPKDNMFV
jgi:hypothetical protein